MKLKILFLAPAMGLLITACSKKLDLAPENTVVDKDVFKTESGAEQALSEGYYDLVAAATGSAYLLGDVTTPNLEKGTYYATYDEGAATPSDDMVNSIWTAYFKTINIANNVIAKIPVYATFSEDMQAQFIAEARFVRAYCYLDLLKLFGEGALTGNEAGNGVPLQLTPFQGYNTGEVIPRSANGQVFDQIISDLESSVSALPSKHNTSVKTRSRATQGSAYALLARTYLYRQQYAQAAQAAAQVLALEPDVYVLATDLLQVFPSNTSGAAQTMGSEYVFGLPVSEMTSSYTSANNGIGSMYYFKRYFWISSAFKATFESGDRRVSQLMFKGDTIYNTNMLNELTTFKFNNQNGRDNVPLIRLPEVILTRAEALARTEGVTTEAISLLNDIRSRSLPAATSYTINDFTSGEQLVDRVLEERRFELAFEGLYRYDLIRTGQPLHSPDLDENKKVLPIPQSEIDISGGLIQQNTGYMN